MQKWFKGPRMLTGPGGLFTAVALILTLGACYPGDISSVEETDVVLTIHNGNDFSGFSTYAMPDTIVDVCTNVDDPECEDAIDIETEKITNVYESPVAGVLRRQIVAAGDSAPVGALLGVALVDIADGDARVALNNLEVAGSLAETRSDAPDRAKHVHIALKDLEHAIQKKALVYDKSGEEHYNIISALHKSLRGSDPDAALYWLERMLAAGDDPIYILRRMIRLATEDIGLADPGALTMAMNADASFRRLGRPEGDGSLYQAAVYLATAPKSNAVYAAQKQVRDAVKKHGALPVPMHIRNAPTGLMKQMGYGKGYKYAHDYKHGYASQSYLPEPLEGTRFYHPTARGYEKIVKQRLDAWLDLKKTAVDT